MLRGRAAGGSPLPVGLAPRATFNTAQFPSTSASTLLSTSLVLGLQSDLLISFTAECLSQNLGSADFGIQLDGTTLSPPRSASLFSTFGWPRRDGSFEWGTQHWTTVAAAVPAGTHDVRVLWRWINSDLFPDQPTCGAGEIVVVPLAGVPVALCGNGNVEEGEQCDDGLGNGTLGSCCTEDCQFASAGTVCRAAAGVCDVAENCTGTSAACPADGFASDGTACDDGDLCTMTDQCVSGVCTGTAVDCDDGIACTTDTCDPATGCATTPVDAACDDSNVCTTDTCDTVLGCLNDGTGITIGCDDGNACTTGDVCQGDAAGTCAGTDTSAVDCDDGIACTTDTCDPATGCANTPVNAACDDGNVCTVDTCDTALGCLNDGTGITIACDDGNACTTGDACQGDAAGTCSGVACILDLDGNGIMGTGDFALFAACFGVCYPPGDPCLVSNFDGDPNGCVGTSDFAAWVGCFGLTCGECAGCAGPGLGAGAVASAASSRASSMSASVQVVARRTPSVGDVALSLPRSSHSFTIGEKFYIEVWASRTDNGITNTSGLASVFVDLMYDPGSLGVEGVMPSGRLGIFSGGQLLAGDGLVSSLGGCANLGETTLGADGAWVRVSTLAMRATAAGTTRVSVGPSDELHGVAVIGEFTNIASGMIEFGHADLTVLGARKATNRIRGRR